MRETKATDLFKDQLIGEEIYWGKREDRPQPNIGDVCYVKEDDGSLYEHEVTSVSKKQFCTKSITGEDRICIGIPINKFRPKNF